MVSLATYEDGLVVWCGNRLLTWVSRAYVLDSSSTPNRFSREYETTSLGVLLVPSLVTEQTLYMAKLVASLTSCASAIWADKPIGALHLVSPYSSLANASDLLIKTS